MASKRSELFLSPENTPRTASHSKYLHPDYSEEGSLHPPESRYGKDKLYLSPGDTRISGDLNFSSMQTSTQQSLNFKHSYFLSSPKRTEVDSIVLTQAKLEENENSLALRLEDKLKQLENRAVFKKSQDLNLDHTVSAREELDDSHISFEGPDDLKIPQLRWCASCKAEVMTQVVYVNTDKTFWSSVGIFITGGFLGCFLLPYMMNSCKGARLVCHGCQRVLL